MTTDEIINPHLTIHLSDGRVDYDTIDGDKYYFCDRVEFNNADVSYISLKSFAKGLYGEYTPSSIAKTTYALRKRGIKSAIFQRRTYFIVPKNTRFKEYINLLKEK